jgi:hemerythrin-like domain-containing protein
MVSVCVWKDPANFPRMKITEILVAEHRIFLNVFEQIERALTSVTTLTEARMLARLVEGLLESHAGTETELAYLALDHVLQDKGQLDRLHEEHHEIDTSLHLVHLAGDVARARLMLQTAIWASRKHFAFEEESVFPLIESALLPETLAELATTWRQQLEAQPAAG